MTRVIILLDSDKEDDGTGRQAGRELGGAAIASAGEASKLVKPEVVDDVGSNPVRPGALPTSLRVQGHRAPSSPSPVPAAVRKQPEIIAISDEDNDGSRFRRVRRVKDEASDWVLSAKAKRAMVSGVPPGSSDVKRKRKRGSSGAGDFHALDRNLSASGAGRRTSWMAEDAGSSRNVSSSELSRGGVGDRSGSTKKARGAPGKTRRGGGTRRERSTSAAPANLVGGSATVGSRIRLRSRQQGRVQCATYSARVSSEDMGEDEKHMQEQTRVEDVEFMAVDDDYDDVNVAGNVIDQESEQDEALEGRSSQDSHGYSEDKYKEGKDSAALSDNEEDVGEKELLEEEEEGADQEESHIIYDGEEEQEEDASEEETQELDETGEAQPFNPSNTMAGSTMRSGGDGKQVFRRRVFEGIYLPENPHRTVGKGIQGRTRSQRKCKDKKLLKRGTFSKPYNIDVPDSTSDSEEEIEPPAPQQGLLSSSEEDNMTFGKRKRRRAAINKRWDKRLSASSDEEDYGASAMDAKERPFRRLKKGLPNLHAAEEGCRNYEGSNPGHARYSGPNGGNLENMSSAQDDISFKRNVHMIRIKKRGRAAKAVYDELLDSLFSGWENHIGNPVHAEAGNSLPLVFSFGDEDAEENTENDKYQEQEDLWMECGIAFQSMNIGSNGCEEVFNLLLYYHSAYTLFLIVVFLILRMLCPL